MHLFWFASTLCAILAEPISAVDKCLSNDSDVRNLTDRYVVTLKQKVNLTEHILHIESVTIGRTQGDNLRCEGVVRRYEMPGFKGYAGFFSKSIIDRLKENPEIDTIEPDQAWNMVLPPREPPRHRAGYSLSLISHRRIMINSNEYSYDPQAMTGTYAYVLGTGINIRHAEFEGRASLGYNAVNIGDQVSLDVNGEGTHIAGIIGSRTYGVVKGCHLIAVKAYHHPHWAVVSQVLDAYIWAANNMIDSRRTQKGVIMLPVTGRFSKALSKAINSAFRDGVSTVDCAGNKNKEISARPGESSYAITVSATDESRRRAQFANWGRGVNMYAPGTWIVSTTPRSKHATGVRSGTAQAAAHVAGLILYFKRLHTLPDAHGTKVYLLRQALDGVVQEPDGKRRPFAYNGSGR
ncbi:subtilisin-like protein [Myriangium duriaei CBS 260.36]|uniref:Subtilisin-like protein n=1 Tax=Myriangium duriaei CBS 260.36 TaxID=1168546 RepID=A0A9P4J3L9_9PEZI|nr:subtilisin-like protein [Myriangium duriaei CBS 260.36]